MLPSVLMNLDFAASEAGAVVATNAVSQSQRYPLPGREWSSKWRMLAFAAWGALWT